MFNSFSKELVFGKDHWMAFLIELLPARVKQLWANLTLSILNMALKYFSFCIISPLQISGLIMCKQKVWRINLQSQYTLLLNLYFFSRHVLFFKLRNVLLIALSVLLSSVYTFWLNFKLIRAQIVTSISNYLQLLPCFNI